MRYRENATSGGAVLWLFQRVSGVYLAVVLFAHVWLLHYLLREDLTFSAVAQRVATPLWKTIDISFLVVALFHGLYGLWIVLEDYIHWGWARIFLYSAISVVAIVALVLGILTILPFQAGGF
jgi:succinate dehydrogenase / fumarate reductase membrane anchor subunit